jgi:hypothetical protein
MSYQGPMLIKEPELRWPIVLLAAIITTVLALLVAGMHYLAMNQPLRPNTYSAPCQTWELQAGQSEFEQFKEKIVVDQLVGREKLHPFNNLAVELKAVVTNRTGRAINGLEMRGTILDSENSIVRKRTAVIVPVQQTLLEADEAITARVLLERLHPNSDRAQTVLEVTGISFEE